MVTFVLFHPAALRAGEMDEVTASGAVTVNVTALLAPTPVTFTTTGMAPSETDDGTGALIEVALHKVGAPTTPPKVTVLLPWVDPKLAPVIVTDVPTGPVVGERLVIAGARFVGGTISTMLKS
jgi:hypothetical protein